MLTPVSSDSKEHICLYVRSECECKEQVWTQLTSYLRGKNLQFDGLSYATLENKMNENIFEFFKNMENLLFHWVHGFPSLSPAHQL